MYSLIEIIRTECVPNRNCMLTVFDQNAESGFLYFKDTQLIEVNTGKLWGIHALGEIFKWQITSFTIGELPIGIKRSLWDPLDKLLEKFAGEGAAAGLMDLLQEGSDGQMEGMAAASIQLDETSPLAPFVESVQQLPGFHALFQEDQNSLVKLVGKSPISAMNPEWFDDFYSKTDIMSESLGAGLLLDWYIELESCRVWKIEGGLYKLIIMSDLDSDPDDFEQNCRSLLKEVVQ